MSDQAARQERLAEIRRCWPTYHDRGSREDIQWLLAERDALAAQLEQTREALREADKEASIAHDAIWHETVQGVGGTGIGRLHDNDDPLSAQSAIWRLHDIARAALVVPEEQT